MSATAHHDEIFIPRWVALALVALCLFTIVSAGIARATRTGTVREHGGAAVRSVTFALPLAQIGVHDAPRALIATTGDGRRVMLAADGAQVFPRLILQGVANLRARDGASLAAPLRLDVATDGERLLVDPATGRILRLTAFGQENGHSFDGLLS